MLAAIIPADTTQPIRFEEIEAEALQTLQTLVGGDVQLVVLRTLGMNMYVNENGKLEELPVNFRATFLCHEINAIFPHDYINGDAVFLGPVDEDEGEDTSLAADQIALLEALPDAAGSRRGTQP
jgi:hypothetical protein